MQFSRKFLPGAAIVGIFATLGSACVVSSTTAKPATTGVMMQAIQFEKFGTSRELQAVSIAQPQPKAGEVLVKVAAAGINPVDWKVRNGEAKALVKKFPVIPGYDLAGEIVAVGEGVTTRKIGEQVFAMRPLTEPGAYAEYATVAADLTAIKPQNASLAESAALPLASLTAYQALFEAGELKSGQTLLIHGAAGGVGHLAVQMAKNKGVKVIGTGSERSVDYIKSLGADQVINYKTTKFETVVKDVDLVLDTIGGDTLDRSYSVIKKGGRIVSLIAKPDPQKAKKFGVLSGDRVVVYPSGKHLAEIAKLVDQGAVKVTISELFPLKDVIRATEQSETGTTRGKLVLQMQ